MTSRLAATIVFGCLYVNASAQTAAPNLSREQRDLLKAIVSAVDASTQPETADLKWQHHVLRASDGSHYVAFSIVPPADLPLPAGPVMLYLRLATATPSGVRRTAERSPVSEWLAGRTIDPRLLPNNRGIAIGEMPIMGPTGNFGARQPVSTGSNELRLMALERERQKAEQEERDKQRRARNEGIETSAGTTLPFEDFDLASQSVAIDGTRILTRAFTAGPGDYDVYLAWADPEAPKPAATIRVIRRSLQLPPASSEGLTTSTIILADKVGLRAAPYSPAEQASHPYSIGVTEVTPAPDAVFADNENLNVFFQVINAASSDSGKPDVEVASRIVRRDGEREQPVASLTPLTYSAETMPPDFNLRLGHPLLAGLAAPLSTLSHGSYRLKVIVNDRIGNRAAQSDVDFTVRATPASLLRGAPALRPGFRKEVLLEKNSLAYLAKSLRPAAPSAALDRALELAAAGRMIDLMVEEPVAKGEEGIRAVLTGLSHLSVGNVSAAVQFQRAVLLGAPLAPARLLSGAARAVQGRDGDAIAAWLEALKAGAPREIIAPLLLDAYLRRTEYPLAAALVRETKDIRDDRGWTLRLAALDLAQRNESSALGRLDALLAAHPEDLDARWLRIHALFSQLVGGNATARERFEREARGYIAARGEHSAIAEEWLRAIS